MARVSVIIPTLRAGEDLGRCLAGLRMQTFRDTEIILVDNSGTGLAEQYAHPPYVWYLQNAANVGFGAAINQGIEASEGEYVVALNDDAQPKALWLDKLVAAMDGAPEAGMAASEIRLESGALDSAGLNLYPDGTAKQRAHGERPEAADSWRDALLPSGCAALYRRAMIEEVGGFDGAYFLYGEDSDLGLRGRLAGWECLYVPGATVDHGYSGSAGRASLRKAFYVERNRLLTVWKLFPLWDLCLAPYYNAWRYWQMAMAALTGRGLAGEAGGGPVRLALVAGWAQMAAVVHLPRVLMERVRFRKVRKLDGSGFRALLRKYRISAGEIAGQ